MDPKESDDDALWLVDGAEVCSLINPCPRIRVQSLANGTDQGPPPWILLFGLLFLLLVAFHGEYRPGILQDLEVQAT